MFIESYHPRSFRERGVTAPFTTPVLAGARLKVTAAHGSRFLEVAIPSPSLRRGTYVMSWSERRTLCRSTLHDTRLGEVLAGRPDLASIAPRMVRQVGWAVAAEGLAGAEAAAAAARAIRADALRAAAVDAVLQAAVGPVTAERTAAIGRLAAVLADIAPFDRARAPVPALLDALEEMARELSDWAAERVASVAVAARSVAMAAELVHTATSRVLHDAQARLRAPAALISAWLANPEAVQADLMQADWLLDGWKRLVLLWRDGSVERGAVVSELAALLPVWPDEAETWLGLPPGTTERTQPQMPPLRSPRDSPLEALEQIARNERLRGLAL